MNKIKQTTLFVALLSICMPVVYGYNLKQISSKDGMSNSAVLSMSQDVTGLMWFGTCDGLNMFDGLRINIYKPIGEDSNLSGNLIEGIIDAGDGIYWIYTNYGLDRLDKKNWQIEHYNMFKGKYQIKKDRNNNIYIINRDNTIYYYRHQSKTFEPITIDVLSVESLLTFFFDKDNMLWLINKQGHAKIYSVDKSQDGIISMKPKEKKKLAGRILSCFTENNSIYYIDSAYTLYEYRVDDSKKQYIYNLKNEVTDKGEISGIIKNGNNYFIGFKTNGLVQLKYKPENEIQYELETIDIKAGIFCLLKDRYQDIVWVGTDGQGVYMYSNDNYTIKSATFANLSQKISKPVRTLYWDRERTLWIGTKGDGILRIPNYNSKRDFSDNQIEYISSSNSALYDNSVYAFGVSNKNILWIGNESGLNYYSYLDRKIRQVNMPPGEENIEHIHAIYQANDSTVWIATVGTGIIRIIMGWNSDNPYIKNIKRYIVGSGEPDKNYFFTIFNDEDKNLWFGNRGYGAFTLDQTQDELRSLSFDQAHNQTMNDIYAIAQDRDKNYWFGSSFGLIKYSRDRKKTVFNDKNGFPNNTIHSILEDSDLNFWLSTNRGLVKFNTEQETFQIYDHSNGLAVIEFSDGASFKDSTENILFMGGINGFVTIAENKMYVEEYFPPIRFNTLSIFGKEYNLSQFMIRSAQHDKLELSYKQNFFSISFSAINYINGNNYTFMYKLDGMSENWIDNGTANTISFTNVAPGEYNLYVKYRDNVSGKESIEYAMSITILPPWYLSTWAYLVYALLAILAIYIAIKYVVRRNEKKNEEVIEKMEQQHQKDVYESKLSFFTNIAHEFCTPLTLIYGPCNRLLNYEGSDDNVKRHTYLIQRNARRLNNLIQELIEFRRIDSGNREPRIESLNVSDLIFETAESFLEMAESNGIKYERNIKSDLIWNSDKGFIVTTISNLISNAFKYTKEKGEIRLSASIENDSLSITVSNTGKGIKQEDIPLLFNRYNILTDFETKDDTVRNGLGLAISYNMIKLLNGTIEVSSTRDEWTHFIVNIPDNEINTDIVKIGVPPADYNSFPKEEEPIVEIPQYPFNKTKLTILVIDNDPEILWLISECLAEEFNVIPLVNPMEMQKVLNDIHPDIIICDIMMPGIDGVTLTKQIKDNKNTSHIPMILISAKHEIEKQIEALEAGAEMYITKPFNVEYLKTSVKQQLSRKEALKDYFNSPISAFQLSEGKLAHKENKRFVHDIYDIISKNITKKDLSPQFIAMQLNMSTRHLYRKIAEIEEQSPTEMIKESRLHIARNMLINTKMTIDEVIYKSGFSNRSTFFKAFSEKYKCTPKEFREKHISNI